ncbi:MAG: hypothetical protein R8K49_07825 [Mariprofundaceae bacterium]
MNNLGEHEMNSVEKNMGFIYDSRSLDALLTVACIGLAALGVMMNDDMMVAFAVPAGIGLFRQFVPLLTFPFIVSIFFSGVMISSSSGVFELIGFY